MRSKKTGALMHAKRAWIVSFLGRQKGSAIGDSNSVGAGEWWRFY